MTLKTNMQVEMSEQSVDAYLHRLINSVYKILPLRERGDSAGQYMKSLQRELYGVQQLLPEIGEDGRFITLLSILQYQIDHPDCEIHVVKSEVFRAINLLGKIREQFSHEDT